MSLKRIRCAIYTRKSSDEGLEQSFNSLQAQREACEAYVASQRHEGWQVIRNEYDDGGFSGGSMERPALKRLLGGISSGKIDTVAVYKVDRLTRSLSDFAKIIEIFDARKVSFVSVTQQFNTTTSMGRLTLNVLLSFAQFEREVTGERIRDKISASKRKGMWMGGRVPLGYDLKNRKLVINEEEAKVVREIFRQYLRFNCVRKLKRYLDELQIRTKVRVDGNGRKSGGTSFSRGALYQVLKNRLYIGQVHHRGQSYEGQHEAIIDPKTWEQVARSLEANRHARRTRSTTGSASLLAGLFFDEQGWRYTPTHAHKKGRRYRYYTSQAVIQGHGSRKATSRIPAQEIERPVLTRLGSFFRSPDELIKLAELAGLPNSELKALLLSAQRFSKAWPQTRVDVTELIHKMVRRVVLSSNSLQIEINPHAVAEVLLRPPGRVGSDDKDTEPFTLSCPLDLKRHSNQLRLVVDGVQPETEQRVALIKAIARARSWYDRIVTGEIHSFRQLAVETGLSVRYVSRIIRCASASPALTEAILRGEQPSDLTVERLMQVPLSWDQQRAWNLHTREAFPKRKDDTETQRSCALPVKARNAGSESQRTCRMICRSPTFAMTKLHQLRNKTEA